MNFLKFNNQGGININGYFCEKCNKDITLDDIEITKLDGLDYYDAYCIECKSLVVFPPNNR